MQGVFWIGRRQNIPNSNFSFTVCFSYLHSRKNYVNSFNQATEECEKLSAQLAYIPPNMDDVIENYFKKHVHGGTAFPSYLLMVWKWESLDAKWFLS